jgi:beta-ureidopropionase / N-carbamoyl-L-amino-acid hydrolase
MPLLQSVFVQGAAKKRFSQLVKVCHTGRVESAMKGPRAMSHPGENLKINADRLWDSLMEMARIGPGVAGGNNRQTLTDADGEGRALFKTWCEAAGCTVGVDTMGNMFATRPGEDPQALPVYVGSHLDTQPTGGKYDGVLGVLGGLELVRTLNDLGVKTRHPIVVTNWTNEEGTRFAPAMLASGVFAGVHTEDWAKDRTDHDGKRFGDELRRIGWEGDEPVGARKMHALFELHIEQGPILEAEGKDIGVVTHGQGLSWTQVTITGKEAHTGSTPMPMRRNAGLGMARVLEAVDAIALSHAPHAVGAAGHIEVFPNSRNVIPGKAVFTVDFRHPELAVIEDMEKRLRIEGDRIAEAMGLSIDYEKVGGFDPVTFDETCVSAVRNAAERLGYSHRDIISGAGHDACWINQVAPTAMIMCPCVDGLSHNEAEDISKDWAAAGADVLLHAALEVAEIVE